MDCSIEGCTKAAQARTWCGMHYMRWFTNGSTDVKSWDYVCALCQTAFQRPGGRGNYGANKFCSARCRNRYQIVVNKYHITVERYRELIVAGCAICGTTEDLVIDHDHECCPDKCKSCGDCVRAALCGDCNRGIGLFREDAALLMRAASYIGGYEVMMDMQGSPHQWMMGDYMGPANSVAAASAKPDDGEANAAVAASGSSRDGHGVLDVPNMSNPGTHMARS